MGTVNRRAELLRSLKFTLFSASAGLIQIGAFALCNDVIRLPAWLGYLIALVLSVLWNFTLNRRYTFRSAASVPRAMALVALFYLVFTPCTTWLEHWLTDVKLWNDYLVTALNMVLNLVLEFLRRLPRNDRFQRRKITSKTCLISFRQVLLVIADPFRRRWCLPEASSRRRRGGRRPSGRGSRRPAARTRCRGS